MTPGPTPRRAAGAAVDAIDSMLGEPYGLRARLAREIRASDDIATARSDALLQRLRGDQR